MHYFFVYLVAVCVYSFFPDSASKTFLGYWNEYAGELRLLKDTSENLSEEPNKRL